MEAGVACSWALPPRTSGCRGALSSETAVRPRLCEVPSASPGAAPVAGALPGPGPPPLATVLLGTQWVRSKRQVDRGSQPCQMSVSNHKKIKCHISPDDQITSLKSYGLKKIPSLLPLDEDKSPSLLCN